MAAFYVRNVFMKSLNNSICAKFKTDFSKGVNALSGGKDLCSQSAFLFQCSIFFSKYKL